MKHLTITLYYQQITISQYHIYIHLPQKKEFIFKFLGNQNIFTTQINQELSSHLESIR